MSPSEGTDEGMKCFNCGKLARNIHLCKVAGVSQIICDECCNKFLAEKKCQQRSCGHYR
ncbi:MAG TPA: hypothetical protein VMV49_13200 [Candidatus Deferrimicrobium sp.]|nr:hypothetical protein [Candidatus Deferrimicrobium sp.]